MNKPSWSASHEKKLIFSFFSDSATNPVIGFDKGESSMHGLTFLNAELHDIKTRMLLLETRPLIYSTKIHDLLKTKYKLTHPVDILIEKYDDEYIAKFAELEVFGSGTTESESIINLKKEIVQLYKELVTADESELGALPAMWKRILLKLIVSVK